MVAQLAASTAAQTRVARMLRRDARFRLTNRSLPAVAAAPLLVYT